MFDNVFVGQRVAQLSDPPAFNPITKVVLFLDGSVSVEAGDTSGRTLEAECPYATPKIAADLLEKLQGYEYQPFSAVDALIDPAAELGDAVTVGGIYSLIAQMDTDFDTLMPSSLSAPGEEEIENEYKFQTQEDRLNKRLAGIRSQITKTAEQILLEVSKDYATVDALNVAKSEFSASIDVMAQSITSSVSEKYLTKDAASGTYVTEKELESQIKQTADSITSTVKATYLTKEAAGSKYRTKEQVESQIKQASDSITSTVAKTYLRADAASNKYATLEKVYSQITQEANRITSVVAEEYATKSAMSTVEQTADKIKWLVKSGDSESNFELTDRTATLVANKIDFSGYVTFTSLDTPSSSAFIDGGNIKANTLRVDDLHGDVIYLYNDSNKTTPAATLTLRDAQTATSKLDINAEAVAITTNNGYLYLQSAGGAYFQLVGSLIYSGATLSPDSDGGYDLGWSKYRWGDIYAVNNVIQTSDRRQKKNITYGLSRYDGFFDKLKPSAYQMVNGTRTHTGLVAQDIEVLLEECGIDTTEFAGFVKSPREDGSGYDYGLRYAEFIPLLIEQVQNLKIKVKELERHEREKAS